MRPPERLPDRPVNLHASQPHYNSPGTDNVGIAGHRSGVPPSHNSLTFNSRWLAFGVCSAVGAVYLVRAVDVEECCLHSGFVCGVGGEQTFRGGPRLPWALSLALWAYGTAFRHADPVRARDTLRRGW